ncbi:Iron dependent oxidoreductase [Globisporangium polare]
MLSITQFPRRFPTANKRALRSAAAAAATTTSSSPFGSAHSLHDRSGASANAGVVAALSQRSGLIPPSTSPTNAPHGARFVQTSPPAMPRSPKGQKGASQSFATAASAVEDEYDDSYLHGERSDNWFTTSRNPRYEPSFPGMCPETHKLSSIAMPNLKTCTREEMLDYLDNTWALTDALFSTLQGEEAFTTPPPHQLRHPLIFYYGHPTVFYVNKFVVSGLLEKPVNPHFEHIFEVGVDEMRWDDMSKNEMEWPSVSEVTEYRRTVYNMVRDIVSTHEGLAAGHAPIDESSELWALCMVFEHERIHLETSSMLMLEHPVHFFAKSSLLPEYHESAERAEPAKKPVAGVDYPVNELLDIAGGRVAVGKPRDFPTFGWDNEYGYREVQVPACKASKFMISNGEFFDFVNNGGYLEPSNWSQLGWEWRCFRNTKWPQFWVPDGPSGSHQYKLRAIFDVIPMQWDWPAQVNLHEAQAFCKWKNERDGNRDQVVYHLNTEPLHQLMRNESDRSADAKSDDILTVRNKMVADTGKNLNVSHMSFSPVDAMAPSQSGFHDVFGNAWEWCEDMFSALPGFQLHKYYDDFSAPCFDGEHHVIMGGSFISSGDNGASKFARYHFRPHFFQHAGFRLVAQSVDTETQSIRLVTTDVNSPGPVVNTNKFRTSEYVSVSGSSSADGSGGSTTNYQLLFDEIHGKTERVLETFMQRVGSADANTLLVRSGVDGALRLKEQVKPGDTMVVISRSSTDAAVAELLAADFSLVESTAVPVFIKESETECRIAVQTATAWKKN